jgi:hypothetical protein
VRGEIRWRALLPTAVLTGIGSSFYTIAGSIWMPAHVANQYEQFGTFGIALAFVTWLTGLAFVLVFAAVLGPALADGNDAPGRWMRSGQPTAVEPGSLPALPGPSRPMRLSDAFGRGAGGSGVTLSSPKQVNPTEVSPEEVRQDNQPTEPSMPDDSPAESTAKDPGSAADQPHSSDAPRGEGR